MRCSFVTTTALLVTLGALPGAWAQAPSAAPGRAALTVRGNVERALTLTLDDLKRFPAQHIEDVRIVREAGTTASASEAARRYTGCLLRDVLEQAKPVEKNRFELRKSIVVVTAKDGYRAIFSWAELYLSPIGDGALIVYAREGAPLSNDEGPLAMVSLKDTRPGPRHVKWLESIEVRVVPD